MTTGLPGLIIAAPASNGGKTVLTLALLRHLRDRGNKTPIAFKTGPDYIDPAFHQAATGSECWNLDPWAMRPESLAALIATRDGDGHGLAICEGVMGLYDGAATGRAVAGSTADLAALTGWPIIFVVDVGGQGASAAALVRGFATHRPDITLGAVVFNRVGGKRHEEILRLAMAEALPDLPVLGALPTDPRLALPSRHLGLVQAREHPDLEAFLDQAAAWLSEHIDTGALTGMARPARLAPGPDEGAALLPPLGQRIAIAHDDAFAFSYPALIESWRKSAAEISFFSPLQDQPPDPGADAVYLPGGYPELHAGKLAANRNFIDGLKRAADAGINIFGECGGYMVLGQGLIDGDAIHHSMAGLLPLVTSFAERQRHLGYRQMRLKSDGPLGKAGGLFRGHEFHYATIVEEGPGDTLFDVSDAAGLDIGSCGLIRGSVAGSFIHLIDRAAAAA